MAENTPKGNYLKLLSIGVIYGAQCCAYCKNCGIVYGESDEDAVDILHMCEKHDVPVCDVNCCDYFKSLI